LRGGRMKDETKKIKIILAVGIVFLVVFTISLLAGLIWYMVHSSQEGMPFLKYEFNGQTDECKEMYSYNCGAYLSECKSGKEYKCVTNLVVLK
jgi:uncharacterized membrane protein